MDDIFSKRQKKSPLVPLLEGSNRQADEQVPIWTGIAGTVDEGSVGGVEETCVASVSGRRLASGLD